MSNKQPKELVLVIEAHKNLGIKETKGGIHTLKSRSAGWILSTSGITDDEILSSLTYQKDGRSSIL